MRAGAVALLLCGACAFQFDRPLKSGEVRGKLLYETPGSGELAAAAGARVRLVGTTLGTLADENGAFLFAGVPLGTHTVHARFEVPGGSVVEALVPGIEIRTRPGGAGAAERNGRDLGKLVLGALGTVSGTVTRDGAGVAGAQVVANGHAVVETGEDGSYVMKLPKGEFDLAAVYPDAPATRVTAQVALRVRGNETVDFAVSDADADTGSVAGAAYLATGDGAGGNGGIRIKLLPAGGGEALDVGETNSDGLWAAADVPAGVFTLVASATDFRDAYIGPIAIAPTTEVPPLFLDSAVDCDGDGSADADDADDDGDGIADEAEAPACRCEPGGQKDAQNNGICDNLEAPALDTTAPAVVESFPAEGATGFPVDERVLVKFSEPVTGVFHTASGSGTFSLSPPAGAGVGQIPFTNTFWLDPSPTFAFSTEYTFAVTTGITDLAGNHLAAPFVLHFTTEPPDTTPPTVTATAPLEFEENVPVDAAITATFSEEMNASTLTAATFTLAPSSTSWQVGYNALTRTATLTPSGPLAADTIYVASLSGDIQDSAGNALAPFMWGFTTAPPPDTTPPTVTGRSPASDDTGVPVNASITATFSEPMNASTISTLTFGMLPQTTSFDVTYDLQTRTATLTPQTPLQGDTLYTALLSPNIADLAGNKLAATSWSFTTADATPPTVGPVTPLDGATGVPLGTTVTATFSEPVDPLTVSTASFSLYPPTGSVTGIVTVSQDNLTATFTPTAPLARGTTYTAAIAGVEDLSGNPLAAPYVWSFSTAGDVLAAAASAGRSCAIAGDGRLFCLGTLVGDGTTILRPAPTPIGSDNDWTQLHSGAFHTCGIRGGRLLCWGENFDGAAGDPSLANVLAPREVVAGATDWVMVGTGDDHSCGVRTDGLWCWGSDYNFQLGDNGAIWATTGFTADPQLVDPGVWLAVTGGTAHTCAIKGDGSLWCWGANGQGQVGDGTTQHRVPFQLLSGRTFKSVAAGNRHSCAVSAGGELFCWGQNNSGQLGVGDTNPRTTPTPVDAATDWAQVAAGTESYFTCAVKAGGSLWCWGLNDQYQFGNGTRTNQLSPIPVGTDSDWSAVIAGTTHACAVKRNGSLFCWGRNGSEQVGLGSGGGGALAPVSVDTRTDWRALASSYDAAGAWSSFCATRADGTQWCWGNDSKYQLGDSATVSRDAPVQVGTDVDWIGASDGFGTSCGIRSAGTLGTLLCWGNGVSGPPAAVDAAADWAQVAVGSAHKCALKGDGTLWCWGTNSVGQLGVATGDFVSRAAPTQVFGGFNDWTAVTAGNQHSCGLRGGNTLYCWGGGLQGQLGIGVTSSGKEVPQLVGVTGEWNAVSAGEKHTCARKGAGTLWCWGYNLNGQIGDNTSGTANQRNGPAEVFGSFSDWGLPFAGWRNTCAVRGGTTLYCWGRNVTGEVGDGTSGTTAQRAAPAQVLGASGDWAKVTPAAGATCGRKSDGTLWCWGKNSDGELGTGTTWGETPQRVTFP